MTANDQPNQIQKIAAYAKSTDREISESLTRKKYPISRSSITRYRNETRQIPYRLARFLDLYFLWILVDILKKRRIRLEREIKKSNFPRYKKRKLLALKRLATKYGIFEDVF